MREFQNFAVAFALALVAARNQRDKERYKSYGSGRRNVLTIHRNLGNSKTYSRFCGSCERHHKTPEFGGVCA